MLILGFLVWSVARGWSEVSEYEWHLDPGLLVAGIAVLLGFYVAAGAGYVLTVEMLGGGHPSRLALLSVWAKSLLGRYVPGNVLMVTGRVVLGREAGVPARVTLAASVYEQMLVLVTAAIASLAFLAGYEGPSGVPWIVLAGAIAAGLALLHPRVFRPLSTWLLARLHREPLAEWLSERELVAMFLYYGAANALLGAGVWLLVRSAAGPEAGDLGYVGLAYLLSFVVSMLAFVFPSGLGVREAGFAIALGRNLPTDVAVAVSVGARLVVTVIELAFVGLVVAAARARGRS
jgi:glycosyltransferase 2 family protein